MKVFTDEFEEVLAKIIVNGTVIALLLLLFAIAGGVEQGLIF